MEEQEKELRKICDLSERIGYSKGKLESLKTLNVFFRLINFILLGLVSIIIIYNKHYFLLFIYWNIILLLEIHFIKQKNGFKRWQKKEKDKLQSK